MRTRLGLARMAPVVLALATTVVLADSPAPAPEFVDAANPALGEVRALGERTIDHVAASLLSEVQRVLRETDPAFALDRLHLKEYKLPPAAPGRPAVISLRRTSLRIRDPANAPDEADLAALNRVEALLERGDPVPKVLIQRVGPPTNPVEWRVYRPLAALRQCVFCHGPPESLAPGVPDAIKTFFPADQATGFAAGSWRGLIRVSIRPTPPAR